MGTVWNANSNSCIFDSSYDDYNEPFFILDSKQWLNDNLCSLRENAILSSTSKIPLVACMHHIDLKVNEKKISEPT